MLTADVAAKFQLRLSRLPVPAGSHRQDRPPIAINACRPNRGLGEEVQALEEPRHLERLVRKERSKRRAA